MPEKLGFFRGPSGLTDPTTVAGLKLWLAADKIVADGNAASDGDALAAWTDHSGGSVSVVQATAGNKPLYKTNIQNSLPAVKFDGVNDFMSGTTAALFSTQGGDDLPLTVIAATKAKDLATFNMCVLSFGFSGSASRPYIAFEELSGPGDVTGDSDGNTASSVRPETGTAHWTNDTSAVLSWKTTGTALSTYINGTATTIAAAAFNNTTKTNINEYAVGALLRIAATDFFSQYIFELLVYDTALSDANRSAVEGYLRTKWAIS